MKKSIFKKLGGLFLGLAMGLGVAVGVTAGNKASDVKAAAIGDKLEKITAISDLTAGSEVVFINSDGKYAMSTSQNKNNRGATSVTVSNNVYTLGSSVQVLTVETGSTSGTYSFNTGSGYLYSPSADNYLRTKTDKDNTASWNISANSNGTFHIQCAGRTTYYMQFNGTTIVSCYKNTQKDFCIYKKAQAKVLSKIELSGSYSTSFTVGDTFSSAGMTVTATYSDNTTDDVTAKATFSGYNMSQTGNQTVTVTYVENSVTKTTTYSITVNVAVNDWVFNGLDLTAGTGKVKYVINSDFDPSGYSLMLKEYSATLSQTKTTEVTPKAFSGFSSAKLGKCFITATYDYNGIEKVSSQLEISITSETYELNWTAKKYVADNNCTISTNQAITKYATIIADDKITFRASGTGANNSGFWGSTDAPDWRLYQNGGGGFTISAAEGYKITSVTVTYGVSNTGTLKEGDNIISSGTTYQYSQDSDVSSITYSVGNTKSGTTNGQAKITAISVTYESAMVTLPTKATISFKSGFGTYYTGTANTSKIMYSHFECAALDDRDSVKSTTGFTVYIYCDTELAATLASESDSFIVGNFSSQTIENPFDKNWTATCSFGEIGEEGTEILSETPVSITVIKKNINGLQWAQNQTTSLISHFDKLKIDGKASITLIDGNSFNDKTNGTASLHFITNVYLGSSASGEPLSSTEESYADYTSRTTSLFVDSDKYQSHTDGTLNYSTSQTFTVEIFIKEYNSSKLTQTITVLPVSNALTSVTDSTSGTYFVGGTYDMKASATLTYTGGSKSLLSSELLINGGEQFKPTAEGSTTISVAFVKDGTTIATGSYNVEVAMPQEPEEIALNWKESYVAGEDFCLDYDDQLHYGLVEYESAELTIDDYSSLTFEIYNDLECKNLIKTIEEADDGTPTTWMRLAYNGKYMKATFTQGAYQTTEIVQLVVNSPNKPTYTASSGGFELANSLSSGDKIVVSAVSNSVNYEFSGYTTSGTSRGVVEAYTTELPAGSYEFYVEYDQNNDLYAFYHLNEDKSKTYMSHSSGVNGMNGSADPLWMTVDFNNGFALLQYTDGTTDRTMVANTSLTLPQLFGFYKDSSAISDGEAQAGYALPKIYKESQNSGEVMNYIKSSIDYIRLTNDVLSEEFGGLSICNVDTSIFSDALWNDSSTGIKALFNSLGSFEELETIEKYAKTDENGNPCSTYYETMLKLLSLEEQTMGSRVNPILALNDVDNSVWVISAVALVGLTAIGGYFFYRKRKEI